MNRSHNFRSLIPRYAVALTILGGLSACGEADRAGTIVPASGTSWSEGTFVDSGDQAQVFSVEVVAVGGRGGNVAGTIGGDGCLVRTTVRTVGTPFMSQLGTEGQGVASLSANGGIGGYGLGIGGKGGTIGLGWGATGGAGGGGATAVWRDGITIAIAAGGGGASASEVGGWACANNTRDGGDGAGGDTAGKGARLVNGVRTFGAGGINSESGSGGSAGNCNFPTFSSTPQPVAVGGAGAVGFISGPDEGGGGGGAGSCGGGAGANGTSDVRHSGGGGAGLSYGWTESGSEGFAPPTYTPTSSGPAAVFHWVQIAPVGIIQSPPNQLISRILAAEFGKTGPLTSSQGARWRIISGAPSGLELNASTGELRWYAPSIGSWTVTIEAAATSNGLVVAHSRIKIGLWIFIPGMPGTPSAPVL